MHVLMNSTSNQSKQVRDKALISAHGTNSEKERVPLSLSRGKSFSLAEHYSKKYTGI